MTALAVVVAYNLELAGRRKQALHTVSEGNPEEAVVPIVVHTEAVGVVQAVRMAVEVAHMEAAAPNLAAEAGLDHKTSIIPSWMLPWTD